MDILWRTQMRKTARLSTPNSTNILSCVLVLVLFASSASAYTYNNLGEAGGWDDVQKDSTVSYVLDRSDYVPYLSEPGITGAIQNAFTSWSSVPGSSLGFTERSDEGGNYDLTDGPVDSAGPPWFGGYAGDSLDQQANYLHANITFGGWLPNSYFDYLEDGKIDGTPSSILGVTWTGKVRGPLSRKPQWIADIFLNDAWTWSLSGDDATTSAIEIDVEAVMLHELGHAVGLGHSDIIDAVMYPYYNLQNPWTVLDPDDEAGIASLYPEGNEKGGGRPPWAGGGRNNGVFLDILEYDELLLYRDSLPLTQTPEPATLMFLAAGTLVLLRRSKRRR